MHVNSMGYTKSPRCSSLPCSFWHSWSGKRVRPKNAGGKTIDGTKSGVEGNQFQVFLESEGCQIGVLPAFWLISERPGELAKSSLKFLRFVHVTETFILKECVPGFPNFGSILDVPTHYRGIIEQAQGSQLSYPGKDEMALLVNRLHPVDSHAVMDVASVYESHEDINVR